MKQNLAINFCIKELEITNEAYKISIIVPAYNVQKYIKQCLESVINQTYKNLEIIVVNDGSKDKTLDIIENIAQIDERIIVINQENQGVSASRNNGLKSANGDFIMFVDSDDWLDLDTCEVLIKEAVKENADIVMCGYVREYENTSLTKASFDEDKIIFKCEDVKSKLHRRIFGPLDSELSTPEKLNAITTIWGKLYKTSVLCDLKFVPYEEIGMCEDGYFNIFAFEKTKKAVFIKKFLYHYRKVISGGSLTQKKEVDTFERNKKFWKKLSLLIKSKELSDDYLKALYNRISLSLIENGISIMLNNSDKYHRLKTILNDEIYVEAINELKLKYFPLHWKMFFCFAKRRFTLGVELLIKIMTIMMDKN